MWAKKWTLKHKTVNLKFCAIEALQELLKFVQDFAVANREIAQNHHLLAFISLYLLSKHVIQPKDA
jgi:hypothetical protein